MKIEKLYIYIKDTVLLQLFYYNLNILFLSTYYTCVYTQTHTHTQYIYKINTVYLMIFLDINVMILYTNSRIKK